MHQSTGLARGQSDGDEFFRGACEMTATAIVVTTLKTETLTLRRRRFMLRPAAGGENFGA